MKILIIRSHYLGDTLLTMPIIRELKELYPESTITLLSKPGIHQSLLDNFQYLDEIINFNNFIETLNILKKEKFDRVYLFKRSFSVALLSWLANIPERIGFDTDARKIFLTENKKYNLDIHEVQSMFSLIKTCSPINLKEQYYFTTNTEKNTARNTLSQLNTNKQNIIIHPLASNSLKNWRLDHWIELINKLQETNKYNIILSGDTSQATQDYHNRIKAQLTQEISLDLSIKNNTLRENIALYEQCDLVIAVDSGPMHLAAAVQTPVLGIFGPSSIKRWHPWTNSPYITLVNNTNCYPCHLKTTCNNTRECITQITPKQIINSLNSLI